MCIPAQLQCMRRLEAKTVSMFMSLQTLCLTAAGLNPKFLATKNEVLHLIGDRQGVLEGELRRRMGNNPDTSKALR